jgi:hypothetical protein
VRVLLLVGSVATALVAASLATAGQGVKDATAPRSFAPRAKPPPVYVGTNGEYTRAAQGSYCYYSKNHRAICVDYAYPLEIVAQLPVVGGQPLMVDAGKRLTRLSASLLQVEGSDFDHLRFVKTRRLGRGRFWTVKLPPNLGNAAVLDLFLEFPRNGDSSVWAGLEPTERASTADTIAGGPLSQLVRRPAF